MSSPQTTNYENARALIDENSELIKEKEKFESLFQTFLNRYRPYSSVGSSLSEPIIDLKQISRLLDR
jgi:hypothetical protein